jgi:hypothetical protein
VPLVTEALPAEAVEVVASGSFLGTRAGYYIGALLFWGESVDGPDPPLVGVLSWEPLPGHIVPTQPP